MAAIHRTLGFYLNSSKSFVKLSTPKIFEKVEQKGFYFNHISLFLRLVNYLHVEDFSNFQYDP